MNTNRLRVALAAIVVALIGVSCWFFLRQNGGGVRGGAISLPKMIWLGWAVGAWFVVPAILWRDQRLSAPVRRLFGFVWGFMLARGVAELGLLYGAGHWHAAYGIAHDLAAVTLVAVLLRRVSPRVTEPVDHRALQYAGVLGIALLAEAAFATVFLQSAGHARGDWFVSGAPEWTLVNWTTVLTLAWVLPVSGWVLGTLYGPWHFPHDARPLRWTRRAGAVAVVSAAALLTGVWSWMASVEREAARLSDTGNAILVSLKQLTAAFMQGDRAGWEAFDGGAIVSWHRVQQLAPAGLVVERWADGGAPRSFTQALEEWKRERSCIAQAAFKLHLLDEQPEDGEAIARIRFEITAPPTSDRGLWRCRLRRNDAGAWQVADLSVLQGMTTTGPGNLMRDEAAARGLDFMPEQDARFVPGGACTGHDCAGPTALKFQTMRHAYGGVAVADIDNDDAEDVLFCSGGRARLYRNRGDGTFEEWTARAGLGTLWHLNAAVFADLDNDGDADLYCAAFYGPDRLFRNDGGGTFTDVTAGSGLGGDEQVTCCCFFDYDNDGRLDLYLGRFLDAATDIPASFLYARNGEPNRLYRNLGGLTFGDVTEAAGVGETGLTLSCAAADYDEDGDQDLYVANDFGRNVLYRNRGDGTFEAAGKATGTLAVGASMSASWGDYDNDGRLDLYVAALRSNQRWFVQPVTARRVVNKFLREGKVNAGNPLLSDIHEYLGDDWLNIGNHAMSGNALLRQLPDGTFTDRAERAGARPAGWYWGAVFADLNNDGHQDIYAADGWITGTDAHDL